MWSYGHNADENGSYLQGRWEVLSKIIRHSFLKFGILHTSPINSGPEMKGIPTCIGGDPGTALHKADVVCECQTEISDAAAAAASTALQKKIHIQR